MLPPARLVALAVAVALGLPTAALAQSQSDTRSQECTRKRSVCRQVKGCPAEFQQQMMVEPHYCRTCETEFQSCLRIPVRRRTVRRSRATESSDATASTTPTTTRSSSRDRNATRLGTAPERPATSASRLSTDPTTEGTSTRDRTRRQQQR